MGGGGGRTIGTVYLLQTKIKPSNVLFPVILWTYVHFKGRFLEINLKCGCDAEEIRMDRTLSGYWKKKKKKKKPEIWIMQSNETKLHVSNLK